MPGEVPLIIVAFFAVGLWVLARPVSPTRVDRFAQEYKLTLTSIGRERLHDYFARRRRARTTGVLIAAAIGLGRSIPDNRLSFAYVPMLAAWLLGAIAAEAFQRGAPLPAQDRVAVRYWWRSIPVIIAGTAVLSTAAAMVAHSDGVEPWPLVRWGGGAVLTALAVLAATRYTAGRGLSDVDEVDAELGSAATVDAVRGLTIGGSILALACMAQMWLQAVPGPYAEPDQFPVIAEIAIVMLLALLMRWATLVNKPVWGWLAYAAVVVLPLAWAIPVRLAQEPPLTPAAAHATAQLRLAGMDQLVTARTELGLTADQIPAFSVGDSRSGPLQLLGRVDLAPAPSGTSYEVFALDRGTNKGLDIYGGNGAGWYGGWSLVLPARYPWLAAMAPVRDGYGFTGSIMAVRPDNSGMLWFHNSIPAGALSSVDDVQLVLMLVRDRDSYVYWATPLPTTSKVLI
jgi:hypothetical protein